MKCTAMLFALDHIKAKSGTTYPFLTFVDTDTGESFRTIVSPEQAGKFQKMKMVEIELSISLGEYQGQKRINTNVINIRDIPGQTHSASVRSA
jgi:hypothetical protein